MLTEAQIILRMVSRKREAFSAVQFAISGKAPNALSSGLYATLTREDNRCMAKHLRISGVVQGVGFRYSMAREARRLGVTGWVRNCRDGTVEAVVEGPTVAVESLLDWARRGPPAAKVKDVSITDTSGRFPQFELRPSA